MRLTDPLTEVGMFVLQPTFEPAIERAVDEARADYTVSHDEADARLPEILRATL